MVKSVDNATSAGTGFILGNPDDFHMREGTYEGVVGLECVSPQGLHCSSSACHLPAPYDTVDTLLLHTDAGIRGDATSLTLHSDTSEVVVDDDGITVDTQYRTTNGLGFDTVSGPRLYRHGPDHVRLEAGGGILNVTGDLLLEPSKKLILPSGSAAQPSLRFSASPTTGLSSSTADQLDISSAGVAKWSLTPSAMSSVNTVQVTDGSSSAPAVTFGADTGLYRSASDNLSVAAKSGGTVTVPATFTSTYAQFPLGVTLPTGDTLSDYVLSGPVPAMTLNGVSWPLNVWNVIGIRIGKLQMVHGIIGWGAGSVPAQTGQWLLTNAYPTTSEPAEVFATPFLCPTSTSFNTDRVFWQSTGSGGFTAVQYQGGSGTTTTTFIGGTDILSTGTIRYGFTYIIA